MTPRTIVHRVVLNAATNWVAGGTSGLIGLLLVPFLIYHLGREGYGLAGVSVTFLGLAISLNFGLSRSLSRHLSEHVARQQSDQFNELCSTALLLYLVLGSLLALGCFFGAPYLVTFFQVPDTLYAVGVFMIRWFASVSLLMSSIAPVFSAVLHSHHRFDLINMRNTALSIIQGLGLFAILGRTALGLYGWALVHLATSLLGLIWMGRLARQIHPTLRIRVRLASTVSAANLVSLGGILLILQIAYIIGQKAHPLILSSLIGLSAVSVYTPAVSLMTVVAPIVGALTFQLLPLATTLHVTAHRNGLQSLLQHSTRYTLLMYVPLFVALTLYAEPLCRLWLEQSLGEEYRVTAHVLICWAVIQLFIFLEASLAVVATAMKRMAVFAWVAVPAVALSMTLSVFFVRHAWFGIVGVILPAIGVGLVQYLILYLHVSRMLSFDPARSLRESHLRPLLVLVLLGGPFLGWRSFAQPMSVFELLLTLAGVGLFWLPLCWWIGFTAEDRRRFKTLWPRSK